MVVVSLVVVVEEEELVAIRLGTADCYLLWC